MARVYFDWAATGLPDEALLLASLRESFMFPGNPSARHRDGQNARACLETARGRCARVLGVPADSLYFVSGGTEANNTVMQGMLYTQESSEIAVSAIEHPSVLECAAKLQAKGRNCKSIKPDHSGIIQASGVSAAISRLVRPRAAAIMATNNETGAVMDMKGLVAAAREAAGPGGKRLHFHCDAVQAAGRVPLDFGSWDIDSASISAHKIGGPRGVGLLYSRKPLPALLLGGGQERNLRSGTENLFGALAMAAALEKRANAESIEQETRAARIREKRLMQGLAATGRARVLPEGRGPGDCRFTPDILQVAFPGIPAEVMVRVLDDRGISVSTGSACSSASAERPVLEAMGVSRDIAYCAIRISQGPSTKDEDIEYLIEAINAALAELG